MVNELRMRPSYQNVSFEGLALAAYYTMDPRAKESTERVLSRLDRGLFNPFNTDDIQPLTQKSGKNPVFSYKLTESLRLLFTQTADNKIEVLDIININFYNQYYKK